MREKSRSQFCTVSEAAELLDVSPVTVWRWIAAGKLTAYRVGPRNIRLRKEDLDTMITPARVKDVRTEKPNGEVQCTTKDELARRKDLIARITAKREQRVITPLTTADLVRMVREDEASSDET